ncbi:helix-turn-helix domain-containing protein [Kaistia granuli]|uniref:helix-turn-helix domain-containing protein n=1 Tax=Kaistia granuli TaxID=363259 RepID=UPI00038050E1|nr:helix-turn-helix domain-containing protein [Kaistia granuli]
MDFLDIGDVAARSGVKPSTLRYYEEVGLISSAWRRGLRRQFGPEVLLQLRLIALGKSAGFSLDEIAAMFGKNGELQMPRGMLHQRADDIDRQIHDLTMMRDTLRHVADCPAPSHLECPSFRRLVDAAGRTRQGDPERAKRRPRPS